jgi:colanic acid/amylovoran biosynthesis protein
MKKILIAGFHNLDNYGSGMMGLVTIDGLSRRLSGPLEFHCDLDPGTDIDEIRGELPDGEGRVRVTEYVYRPLPPITSFEGISKRLRLFFGDRSASNLDAIVVLGGDDISEYYRPNIWRVLAGYWRRARAIPVILLGQTIGPFQLKPNRRAARYLLPALLIVPRDRWTTSYLQTEFGLGKRLIQGSDLAYTALPLQARADIESETLARHGLATGQYATVVVSAMQSAGYYTSDREAYLDSWKLIVERVLDHPGMQGRSVCLLAHTFGRFGDEAANIADLLARLSPGCRARVIPVTQRVLPTRARFILGNGLFTITGRMHPAVSTFQMGKPAVALSYSQKYQGVIGTMIGRADLIVEANDPELWASRKVVDLTIERVDHLLAGYDRMCAEIRSAMAEQVELVETSLDRVAAWIERR